MGVIYHRNPNMNAPTRQKLMHHRPLRREHVWIPLRLLLSQLGFGETGARVIARLLLLLRAARVHHAPCWVGGGPEAVWLLEDAGGGGFGFCGGA